MRKKAILNLIKYHAEKNEAGFRKEAYDIARYFDSSGDSELAQYIMALLSGANTFVPQDNEYNSPYFKLVSLSKSSSLPLPEQIKNDIVGVINSINHNAGVNKFLFEGHPGTGKTETAKQIARILDRELYVLDFDSIIDSKLGQTSKNIAAVFTELRNLPQPKKIIILFDEIDAIALDRINNNDLREMGRVTSSVLKGFDNMNDEILLIATTNLFGQFDKALLRRFDSVINFDRYSREELLEVAESIFTNLLVKFKTVGRNMRLFKKVLSTMKSIPYPGELKNLIKTSLAFSDPTSEFDYLKKLYISINPKEKLTDLKNLQDKGFTVREIEILSGISKSQVSRELNT